MDNCGDKKCDRYSIGDKNEVCVGNDDESDA